ncbi:MAG: TIGR03560 family F420-dependent LLM class oxidoreductase [Nitrososphaerota archaeon]|nr:TIGR03560 family F420-dependent LLM class oxidoreductase [Candidatus Calditenuaceae archaeon]MDW8074025.1 TIGR03560 family F420-dependent LLM class oxidoreductase [Nitrososphaerota archaeon]
MVLPQSVSSYDIVRGVALLCEELGYDSLWLNDHFYEGWLPPERHTCPYLDCWTLLPALAVETEKIRLGSLVTSNTFRHPSLLAKMAATLNVISGGRLDFGIGAGDLPIEHHTYGIPYPSDRERISRLREALQVIIKMWTEEEPSFNGEFYQIREPPFFPKPIQKPHPPIWIGSISGRRLIVRLAAEFADNFNVLDGSPESYAEKMKTLNKHCEAIGRNPDSIRRSWHGFVDMAIKKDDHLLEETIRNLKSMVNAGAQDLILGFSDRADVEALRVFAEQVIPRFR